MKPIIVMALTAIVIVFILYHIVRQKYSDATPTMDNNDSTSITLVLQDGSEKHICPISYQLYCDHIFESGFSDMAFDQWKRVNGYSELSDYREGVLLNSELHIDGYLYRFDCNKVES